jgi:hypothetical protein
MRPGARGRVKSQTFLWPSQKQRKPRCGPGRKQPWREGVPVLCEELPQAPFTTRLSGHVRKL